MSARSLIDRWIWLAMAAIALTGAPAAGEEALPPVLRDIKPIFDARLRFEHADQGNLPEEADALTLRTRFGLETGDFYGFKVLAEGDLTREVGFDNFNSTVNGKSRYPIVADPDSTRLNRLSLGYSGLPQTSLVAGRQRIVLDNSRFIGNVGFRQNEQTFDALRANTEWIKDFRFDYAYVWQVNRIFGSRSAVGDFDSDTHLINASYKGLPFGKLTAYAYLMEFEPDAPRLANQSYGARFAGSQKVSETVELLYLAEYARQMDYGRNPGQFDLDYIAAEGGASWRGFTVKAGYESLEGNGIESFRTPLATLHKFQGFADVFLTTPRDGIEDLQMVAEYTVKEVPVVGTVKLGAWYHDFESQRGNTDYGDEIDLLISIEPVKGVAIEAKFADYHGRGGFADLERAWFGVEYTY
jgi:hypothetical protein